MESGNIILIPPIDDKVKGNSLQSCSRFYLNFSIKKEAQPPITERTVIRVVLEQYKSKAAALPWN